MPSLVLVTGVPGTGKSTVAEAAGALLSAAVIGHDWAMSGLRPFSEIQEALQIMKPPGHRRVGWSIIVALARSELRRNRSVVLDGVARAEEVALCRGLAEAEGATMILVVTLCSDAHLHQARVEGRLRGIPDWYELTWEQVARTRDAWELPGDACLILDAADPLDSNIARLKDEIERVAAGR